MTSPPARSAATDGGVTRETGGESESSHSEAAAWADDRDEYESAADGKVVSFSGRHADNATATARPTRAAQSRGRAEEDEWEEF